MMVMKMMIMMMMRILIKSFCDYWRQGLCCRSVSKSVYHKRVECIEGAIKRCDSRKFFPVQDHFPMKALHIHLFSNVSTSYSRPMPTLWVTKKALVHYAAIGNILNSPINIRMFVIAAVLENTGKVYDLGGEVLAARKAPVIFHLAKETSSALEEWTPTSLLSLTLPQENTKILKLSMIMYL